jgi:hypothetical protein
VLAVSTAVSKAGNLTGILDFAVATCTTTSGPPAAENFPSSADSCAVAPAFMRATSIGPGSLASGALSLETVVGVALATTSSIRSSTGIVRRCTPVLLRLLLTRCCCSLRWRRSDR